MYSAVFLFGISGFVFIVVIKEIVNDLFKFNGFGMLETRVHADVYDKNKVSCSRRKSKKL